VSYAAGTLTLVASSGDALSVATDSTTLPGYVEVKNAATVIFDSLVLNQPVTNLVVKAGTAASYTFSISDVSLTNLTVAGASVSTDVTLGVNTVVNGNFTFTGNPLAAAADTVTIPYPARVGGNVLLTMNGGTNIVKLAGTIGGNVGISALGGADTINIADSGDLVVGGTVNMQLGNGLNKLRGAANVIHTGRDVVYTGGLGDDDIDLTSTPMRIGRKVVVHFGGASSMNNWGCGLAEIGGNFITSAGNSDDVFWFNGATEIGGNLSANLGAGTNTLAIGYNFAFASSVGGSISLTGGAGRDGLYLDNIIIGKNVTATLGDGMGQALYFGTRQAAYVQIGGAVTMTGGNGTDYANIFFSKIGGALTMSTFGNDDRIQIDDTSVNGPVLINLGGGADKFKVDTQLDNGSGTILSGFVRFQSTLTVHCGDGGDTVDLSKSGGNKFLIGGNIKLFGEAGADELLNWSGNEFHGTKFEDLELGDSL
jgi:hypothetical protein